MKRTLDAVAYWKLRALCSDTQRCAVAAVAARDALTTAQQKQTQWLIVLGVDAAAASFELDDEALSVTVPDPPR